MDEIPSNILAAFLGYSNNSQAIQSQNIMFGGGIDADYNRILATSLNDESPVRNVLSEQGEDQIKMRKFTKDDDCDTCPIFHIPFEIDDDVKELPCGHIFTPDGIDKWLTEEKAECPVCRFKLESKEITTETPGVEQWSDDRNEITESRAELAANLRRLSFPRINAHPFGPSSHRIANVLHEDDNHEDVIRALAMTFNGPNIFNLNNHASGGNLSYPSIISNITNNHANNYINNTQYDLRDMSGNSTNISYTSMTTHHQPQMSYDIAASYESNRFLAASPSSEPAPSANHPPSHIDSSSSQDNPNTSDN